MFAMETAHDENSNTNLVNIQSNQLSQHESQLDGVAEHALEQTSGDKSTEVGMVDQSFVSLLADIAMVQTTNDVHSHFVSNQESDIIDYSTSGISTNVVARFIDSAVELPSDLEDSTAHISSIQSSNLMNFQNISCSMANQNVRTYYIVSQSPCRSDISDMQQSTIHLENQPIPAMTTYNGSGNIQDIADNKELQDAVANISDSGLTDCKQALVTTCENVQIHNMVIVPDNSDATSIYGHFNGENHHLDDSLHYKQFGSLKQKSDISQSVPFLKKFTSDDLDKIGTNEDDILNNYLATQKWKNRKHENSTTTEEPKAISVDESKTHIDADKAGNSTDLEAGKTATQFEATVEIEHTLVTLNNIIQATDSTSVEKLTDHSHYGDQNHMIAVTNVECQPEATVTTSDETSHKLHITALLLGSCNSSITDKNYSKNLDATRFKGDIHDTISDKSTNVIKNASKHRKSTKKGPRNSRQPMKSNSYDDSTVELAKVVDTVDRDGLDSKGYVYEDLASLMQLDDKYILKLKPLTLTSLNGKQFIIEIDISDDLCVSSMKRSTVADGFTNFSFTVSQYESMNVQNNLKTDCAAVQDRMDLVEKMQNKIENHLSSFQTPSSVHNSEDHCMNDISANKTDNESSIEYCCITVETKMEIPDDSLEASYPHTTYSSNCNNTVEKKTDVINISKKRTAKPVNSDATANSKSMHCRKSSKVAAKEIKADQEHEQINLESPKSYIVKMNESGKKFYTCTVCRHETNNHQNMTIHTHQHTGERPYQCELCGQTFKGPSNLHAHKRQHSDQFNYTCTECGKQFRDRGTYKQHIRRHNGDKLHVCEHCGKSFVITSDLKKHIRTHTGEKPYKCDVCGRLFGDGSGLVRHRHIHTPIHRFNCGLCHKQFARKDLCSSHIKKLHSGVGQISVVTANISDDKLSDTTSVVNTRKPPTSRHERAVKQKISSLLTRPENRSSL